MNLIQQYRDVVAGIKPALADQFDQILRRINFVWNKEHEPDGQHKAITINMPNDDQSGLIIINHTYTNDPAKGLNIYQANNGDCEMYVDGDPAIAAMSLRADGVDLTARGTSGMALLAETVSDAKDLPMIVRCSVMRLERLVHLPPIPFASLPTPLTGMVATISDSTTNTWGATITGGGAFIVTGFYNGANWTVMGA